jgi:hypothetical protein
MSNQVRPFIREKLDRAINNLWFGEPDLALYQFKPPLTLHVVQLQRILVKKVAADAEFRHGFILARACDRAHRFWCLIHQDVWRAIETERGSKMTSKMNHCIFQLAINHMCFLENDKISTYRDTAGYVNDLWQSVPRFQDIQESDVPKGSPVFISMDGKFLSHSRLPLEVHDAVNIEEVSFEPDRRLVDTSESPLRRRPKKRIAAPKKQDPTRENLVIRTEFSRLAFKRCFFTPPQVKLVLPMRNFRPATIHHISHASPRGVRLPKFRGDDDQSSRSQESPLLALVPRGHQHSSTEKSSSPGDQLPQSSGDESRADSKRSLEEVVQGLETPLRDKRPRLEISSSDGQYIASPFSSEPNEHISSFQFADPPLSIGELVCGSASRIPVPPMRVLPSATKVRAIFQHFVREMEDQG